MGNPLKKAIFANAISAGPVSSNDTAVGTYVDTQGKGPHLTLVFQLGTTTVNMSAIKLQESDTTSGFADITSAALTAANFTATDDGDMGTIHLDLASRKRYINFVADPGAAATIMAGLFIFPCPSQSPANAAEAGLVERVSV
jgi:hypothetical protein